MSSTMTTSPEEANLPQLPRWVRSAAELPLAFAQVREDPEIDRRVADLLPARARVCMVASGGCTAALLAAHPRIASLQAVDPNPAQIALARLKQWLLEEEPCRRLAMLGHSAMDVGARAEGLASCLGALELAVASIASLGGSPALRSRFPPAWLIAAGGGACGRLEDTLAAKRLVADSGELLSLHLACFAWTDPTAASQLLRRGLEIILRNLVEEHGDFHEEAFHHTTFQRFLGSVEASPETVAQERVWPCVRAFNSVLSTACLLDELETGVACMGIIEQAFAGISTAIGKSVTRRGWVAPEDLVHYKLHAEIDERHAEEFFAVVAPAWEDPGRRYFVEQGLELGAYVFDRLYRGLLEHEA